MKDITMAAEEKAGSLLRYRDALADSDRQVFDRLVSYAKEHVGACAKAPSLTLFESMLLAMVIEQQKKIDAMSAVGALPSGQLMSLDNV